jgi:hypothetical protein
VNDDALRAEFARLAAGLPSDDAALVVPALRRGRRLARRRRDARAFGTVLALTAGLAWYGATGPATAPASAAVACYRDRVVVGRQRVSVGRHGVQLDVRNETSDVVRVVAGDEVAVVPPGRSSVDVTLRPGPVSVSCESGAAVTPVASITVTDRHHFYIDDALDCARPSVRAYRGTGDIVTGDPVALTAARVAGAVPRRALVEPAGYPDAAVRRLVRVRADTYVVGLAVWHAMPEPGTWSLDELRLCPADFLS